MTCKNCGGELESGWNVCSHCGTALKERTAGAPESKPPANNWDRPEVYATAAVVCFVLSLLAGLPFLYPIADILVITGYIRHPESKAMKIMLVLSILITVAAFILMGVLIYSCAECFRKFPG